MQAVKNAQQIYVCMHILLYAHAVSLHILTMKRKEELTEMGERQSAL